MNITRKLFSTPVLAALFMLTGCNGNEPDPTPNPHEGKALTKLTIVSEDSEHTGSSIFTFNYDGQNRISSFTCRQEADETVYVNYLFQYTYAPGNIVVDTYICLDENGNPAPEEGSSTGTSHQVARMTATLDTEGRALRSTYTEAFENGLPMEGYEPHESQYTYDALGQFIRDESIQDGQPSGDAMTMKWENGDLLGFSYTTSEREATFLYTEHANKGLTDINQILSWYDDMEHVVWQLAGVLGTRSSHCALPTYWWGDDPFETQTADYRTETDSDGYLTSIQGTNAKGEKLTVTLVY